MRCAANGSDYSWTGRRNRFGKTVLEGPGLVCVVCRDRARRRQTLIGRRRCAEEEEGKSRTRNARRVRIRLLSHASNVTAIVSRPLDHLSRGRARDDRVRTGQRAPGNRRASNAPVTYRCVRASSCTTAVRHGQHVRDTLYDARELHTFRRCGACTPLRRRAESIM